jgi:hypothetical protein
MNKYFNKKVNGYDSKREFKRANQLDLLHTSGIISNLQEQVPFTLLESFDHESGNERGIKYYADFVYFDEEKQRWVIEDVKSKMTKKLPTYIIKRKLVKMYYPKYLFLEIF